MFVYICSFKPLSPGYVRLVWSLVSCCVLCWSPWCYAVIEYSNAVQLMCSVASLCCVGIMATLAVLCYDMSCVPCLFYTMIYHAMLCFMMFCCMLWLRNCTHNFYISYHLPHLPIIYIYPPPPLTFTPSLLHHQHFLYPNFLYPNYGQLQSKVS